MQRDPAHPMMPTTLPAIFLGWRMDFGVEFGGILRSGDCELFRQAKFSMTRVREVPVQEVYFPEKSVFPFVVARNKASHEAVQGAPPAVSDTEDENKT